MPQPILLKTLIVSLASFGWVTFSACSLNNAEEPIPAATEDTAPPKEFILPQVQPAANADNIIMSREAMKKCSVMNPRGFKLTAAQDAPSRHALTGTISLPNPAWSVRATAQEKDGSVTVILETTPPPPNVQVMQMISDETLHVMLPGDSAPTQVAMACRKID